MGRSSLEEDIPLRKGQTSGHVTTFQEKNADLTEPGSRLVSVIGIKGRRITFSVVDRTPRTGLQA